MAVVCPCVTPVSQTEYQQQLDRVKPFAKRLHLDFMDGKLTPNSSPGVEDVLKTAEQLKGIKIDLHLMYQDPTKHMRALVKLKPNLVIVHAEAEGNFVVFSKILHEMGFRVGIALLPKTPADYIKPALDYIDHVMIFSGDLGYFGGQADLGLLAKAQAIKHLKKSLEIGWDGGVNDQNAHLLAAGGIDVLNAGGFIQKASNPASAYATLLEKLNP